MKIRQYQSEDLPAVLNLFYTTVHTVNAKDYTAEQLDAWAPKDPDTKRWQETLLAHYSLVAEENGRLCGFGDIVPSTGYLDHLYVAADCQRQGIGTVLCDALESQVSGDLSVHASITAKLFFEHRGYVVVKRQEVERHGIVMVNFAMMKNVVSSHH